MDTTIFLTVTSTSTRPIPTNINTLYTPTANEIRVSNNVYTKLITTVLAIVTVVPTTSINFIENYKLTLQSSSSSSKPSFITTLTTTTSSVTPTGSLSSTETSITPDSNKSVASSLAIGLPIAIVVLFLVGICITLLVNKKKFKKLFRSGKSSLDDGSVNNDDDTLTNVGKRPITPITDINGDGSTRRQSVLYYLKDALCRNSSGRNTEDLESNNHTKRLSTFSPMLLKKFNLKQPPIKQNESTGGDSTHKLDLNPRNKLDLKLPVSINKDGLISAVDTKLDPAKGGISPSNKLYVTIQNYSKRLNDELTIVIGNKVVIQQEYLDGWCLVRLVRTGKDYYSHLNTLDTGMVPKVCLRELS